MTITVIVDDTDPTIAYNTGGWATNLPSDMLSKSVGHTLHNASYNIDTVIGGSTFFYHFNGE